MSLPGGGASPGPYQRAARAAALADARVRGLRGDECPYEGAGPAPGGPGRSRASRTSRQAAGPLPA